MPAARVASLRALRPVAAPPPQRARQLGQVAVRGRHGAQVAAVGVALAAAAAAAAVLVVGVVAGVARALCAPAPGSIWIALSGSCRRRCTGLCRRY